MLQPKKPRSQVQMLNIKFVWILQAQLKTNDIIVF